MINVLSGCKCIEIQGKEARGKEARVIQGKIQVHFTQRHREYLYYYDILIL